MADESVELVVAPTAEALAEVLAGMRDAPEPSAEEQAQTRLGIILEMLAAETEDDLWRELPTWSSKDSVGATFKIVEVHAYRSKFKDNQGHQGGFLACRAVNLSSGEVGILNTGAARLAARIGWYKLNGRLPVTVTVVERGETADGYTILDAELVDS
jgi:hypothetical protein